MAKHIAQYAKKLEEPEPPIMKRRTDIKVDLIPAEESEINKVQYNPKKKRKKKKPIPRKK